jgi:CD109 antigen
MNSILRDSNASRRKNLLSEHSISFQFLLCSPKIGDEVSVEVEATGEMKNLCYMLFSRNNLVLSRNEEVPNARHFNFTFQSSQPMMPNANLLVYYISADGEIVSDQQKIDFGFKLQNTVNIDLSADQLKPEEQINLTVHADPNSYVGLLGVDQSVLLLKSGNDIEKSAVISEVEKFSAADHRNSFYSHDMHSHHYCEFENSEIALITNTNEKYRKLN